MLDDDGRIAAINETLQDGEKLANVVEMQAGRRLVQQVERAAGFGASEFGGKLDPLRFAAAERRRGLAKRQIAETDVVQAREHAMDGRKILEEGKAVSDRQVKHVGDGEAFVQDGKRLAIEALAFAHGAVDEQVGEEFHFQPLETLALTLFAAAAGDVEAEAVGLEAELFGFLGGGKNLANLVEDAGVGGSVAAW